MNARAAGRPVVVVNAGSSSLKFAAYDGDRRLLHGAYEGFNATPAVRAFDERGAATAPPPLGAQPPHGASDVVPALLGWLETHLGGPCAGVGHRVVHGGAEFSAPQLVTERVLSQLRALVPLAPLHEPHNLAPIEAIAKASPGLPQVACFDTAFHRTNAPVVQAFALPYEYFERGVVRYGFHGLSYEYVASVLPSIAPEIAGGNVVVAHLGSGASLCAMKGGRSVATTMGFTALAGVPMATRSGDVDPGLLLYLFAQRGMAVDEVSALLYQRSGMLGLSGISADFRVLLASNAPRATFAIDVFVERVACAIASLASSLGGIDGIVFTAGVGENAPAVRAAIAQRCAWMGVRLDPQRNARTVDGAVARIGDGPVALYVIPTNEELVIARHTAQVLSAVL